MYCAAKNVVFGWTMGITHHEHGVDNVQAIVNLALLRGMVGRPHAGLLPIRGHSNVQGIGSVGVTPNLKQQIFDNLETHLERQAADVAGPRHDGLHAGGRPRRDARRRSAWAATCSAAIPTRSSPAERSASSSSITYLNTTLNTGHAWGRGRETLILPVLARDEEPQPTTQESMFNFVRLSDGGPARLRRAAQRGRRHRRRSAERVLGDAVAGRLGRRCSATATSAQMIAADHPRLRAARPTSTATQAGVPDRRPHLPRAALPDADRARRSFAPSPLPPLRGDGDELRLMTVRSEGQFNTVVYEEEDIYRGQERRDVILMNRADIERLGLQRRSARDGAQRGGRDARTSWCAPFDIRAGQRADVLPGGERAGADDDRSAVEDAGVQVGAGDGRGGRSRRATGRRRRVGGCRWKS